MKVLLAGAELCSLQSFMWERNRDLELFFGKGNQVRTVVEGNTDEGGEIGISQEELARLLASSPEIDGSRSLFHFDPFKIVGTYTNPGNNTIHTITASGCRFTKEGTSVSQGDKVIIYTLPFLPCVIKQNTGAQPLEGITLP